MIANERSESLMKSQFRAIQAVAAQKQPQDTSDPVGQVLTLLMKHGGAYTLMDTEMMTGRLSAMFASSPHAAFATSHDVATFVSSIGGMMASFFSHLVPGKSYSIPSSLMSHIALPGSGVAYSVPDQDSPEIAAAFTFVGQFLDHDLTMNAVNLFEPQTGPVQDTASPLIDLDSVYGPRTKLTAPSKKVYHPDGSFRLVDRGGYFDIPRDAIGNGVITDGRNDENQMILQIHLLIMKLHNKLLGMGRSLEEAYLETLFNWQSVVLTDYLTKILDPGVLTFLLTEVEKPNYGDFKHKPCLDLATGKLIVSMPHEFAIGFRFGHSQLKSRYRLNPGNTTGIPLFNNSLSSASGTKNVFGDLRGSQELLAEHVIDWQTFLGGPTPLKGNRIDGKVTSVAFDLPESTIPDDIKYIGNLVHRNLIRSRQVGLCAGEDLADFYGMPRVAPSTIEPDATAHHLFKEHGHFRTPLWYYILKEAEAAGGPMTSRLGKLGSRVIGEVLVGAIKYAPENVLDTPGWVSSVTGSRSVSLLELATWVG